MAEVKINVGNIISGLILSVMAWVGWNIQTMKDDISSIHELAVTTEVKFINLEKRFEEHIKRGHWPTGGN